jgi:hypothetical protein
MSEKMVEISLTEEQYSKLVQLLSLDLKYKNLNDFKAEVLKGLPESVLKDIKTAVDPNQIKTSDDLIKYLFYIDAKKQISSYDIAAHTVNAKKSETYKFITFLDKMIKNNRSVVEETFEILQNDKKKKYRIGFIVKEKLMEALIDNNVINKTIIKETIEQIRTKWAYNLNYAQIDERKRKVLRSKSFLENDSYISKVLTADKIYLSAKLLLANEMDEDKILFHLNECKTKEVSEIFQKRIEKMATKKKKQKTLMEHK